MGIKDANNMGAAMAPAALATLVTHLRDTGRSPDYYDSIITGDLGYIGKDILIDLAKTKGYNISSNYNDCGVLIFDKDKQDTHSGGSGCGCIASVFSGYFFKQLKEGKIKRLLLIATGALMNSTSSQQGETIPGIAHAISIEI
jgi:stage V sporulation protein AD